MEMCVWQRKVRFQVNKATTEGKIALRPAAGWKNPSLFPLLPCLLGEQLFRVVQPLPAADPWGVVVCPGVTREQSASETSFSCSFKSYKILLLSFVSACPPKYLNSSTACSEQYPMCIIPPILFLGWEKTGAGWAEGAQSTAPGSLALRSCFRMHWNSLETPLITRW